MPSLFSKVKSKRLMSMQQSYANILTAVGEDLNRPGLKD
ncbi:GTP cyclohydrolase I FolE, partial [Acinetobacter baumannii]